MNERALEKYRLRKVGFVFQFYNLIPSITAIENIELPMIMAGESEAECHERARTLLGLVGLEAKGQKRPEELSGGEQQRVAVGLALANDPGADSRGRADRQSRQRQRRRDREAAGALATTRQDGDHGQPRPEDSGALPDGVRDARRPVRQAAA